MKSTDKSYVLGETLNLIKYDIYLLFQPMNDDLLDWGSDLLALIIIKM
jgi:hypothetical protein